MHQALLTAVFVRYHRVPSVTWVPLKLLMVIVDDNGDRTNTMEEVRFDSACLLNNFSSLDSGLTTTVVGGVLSVTYTAGEKLCCPQRYSDSDLGTTGCRITPNSYHRPNGGCRSRR